jgi:hypothetical protein
LLLTENLIHPEVIFDILGEGWELLNFEITNESTHRETPDLADCFDSITIDYTYYILLSR